VVSAEEILDRLRHGGPRALPRLATLIENEDPRGLAALDALFPRTGTAHIVGVTGPPGVGKSTLIAALIAEVRRSGNSVAVVAVDPTSGVTGGAVLGDRIRMMGSHADEGVFVRSMASRGRRGGLAWATAEIVHLLDAVGFPLIVIETVGTGQDGTDIASLVDTVVVVEAPGLGDGVQAVKSGLLEVGDIVVVNKADQPGAEDAVRTLRSSFALSTDPAIRRPLVVATAATTSTGIPELVTAIDNHARWLDESGERQARRERAVQAEILAGLRLELERQRSWTPGGASGFADVTAQVARKEITPRQAVRRLIGRDANPALPRGDRARAAP
jgi:LAO/AO transport system kinase